ncbi:MAG: HAD family hydrolase [Proteobacteria bacterium]|nr:HAD family hydrolase [Pseudomonadota bacterium]
MHHPKWPESKTCLQAILLCIEKYKTHNPRPKNTQPSVAVIFDLDSTLFNTKHRSTAIFQSFSRNLEHIQRFGNICQSMQQLGDTKEIYDPIEFLNHHIQPKISSPSILEKILRDYWRERFFHSDWLIHDKLYAGAKAFINKIYQQKHVAVVYLTARCEKALSRGTLTSLDHHQLPHPHKHNRVRLYLKPTTYTCDITYKGTYLKNIQNNFQKCIYIENEPGIVNMAVKQYPKIDSYLYASVHSGQTHQAHTSNIIYSWQQDIKESSS